MNVIPDISHHHPVGSWDKLYRNCPFVISKATEGCTYVDPTLKSCIKNCEEKGIPYWLYTFLRKGNEKAQAEFLVKTCSKLVGNYFVGYVLDVESGNTASGVQKALDYIEKLGGKCMIYTMYAEYNRYKKVISERGKNTAWWEARYGLNDGLYRSKHNCHKGVDLHQFTSRGTCPGISDKIELNRVTGQSKSLTWFCSKSNGGKVYSGTFPSLPDRGYYQRGDGIYVLKDRKNDIKRLQKFLNWYMKTTLEVDGKYGELTEFVVQGFQEKCKLVVDGKFGKKSLTAAKKVKK